MAVEYFLVNRNCKQPLFHFSECRQKHKVLIGFKVCLYLQIMKLTLLVYWFLYVSQLILLIIVNLNFTLHIFDSLKRQNSKSWQILFTFIAIFYTLRCIYCSILCVVCKCSSRYLFGNKDNTKAKKSSNKIY